jgi:hypothetical protein
MHAEVAIHIPTTVSHIKSQQARYCSCTYTTQSAPPSMTATPPHPHLLHHEGEGCNLEQDAQLGLGGGAGHVGEHTLLLDDDLEHIGHHAASVPDDAEGKHKDSTGGCEAKLIEAKSEVLADS